MLFIGDRVGRDPDALLEATKRAVSQVRAEAVALDTVVDRNIKKNEAPSAVPWAGPSGFWIISAKGMQAALFGETIEALVGAGSVAFEEFSAFEFGKLAHQAAAVSPAFEGLIDVPKGRAGELFSVPEEVIKEFFGFGFHLTEKVCRCMKNPIRENYAGCE